MEPRRSVNRREHVLFTDVFVIKAFSRMRGAVSRYSIDGGEYAKKKQG
jgi:hypothetical protein